MRKTLGVIINDVTEEIELKLNQGLDSILEQLAHGNTIDGIKSGRLWMGFEQVKEWKSKFGYQFHIYSNDHFIDNKPHFHLIKKSDNIDCRLFFDGKIIDCQGNNTLDKRVRDSIEYFLESQGRRENLIQFWNLKNPDLKF